MAHHTNRATYFQPDPMRKWQDFSNNRADSDSEGTPGQKASTSPSQDTTRSAAASRRTPQTRLNLPRAYLEESKITKIRTKVLERDPLESIFVPMEVADGVEKFYPLGYLIDVAEMLPGGEGILLNLTDELPLKHVPLRNPGDVGVVSIWALFLFSFRSAVYESAKGIIRLGQLFGTAANIAVRAIDKIQDSVTFRELYLKAASSDVVVAKFLQGKQDTYTFHLGAKQPSSSSSPLLAFIVQTVTIALDDNRIKLLKTLRLKAKKLVRKAGPIADVQVGNQFTNILPYSSARKAAMVISNIGLFMEHPASGDLDSGLFYASDSVQILAATMLEHIGFDLVASILAEGDEPRETLPIMVLGLPATLIEVELNILRTLGQHGGKRMYPAGTANRFMPAEFEMNLRHSHYLDQLKNTGSINANMVAEAVALLEKEMDLDEVTS